MIENLRKYTGLMIVALVAVFVGLIMLVDTGQRGRGGGAPFMRIGDRTYSYEEFGLLGERSLQMANDLRMNLMVGQLGGSPWQPDPKMFFIHRMLLRQAQDDYGVHPSDAEVLDYLRNRSSFVQNGEFNQPAYNEFISRRIGRYGLGETNVQDLVRDYLAFEQLTDLIGNGLVGDYEFNRRAYADQNQKVDLRTVTFTLADYERDIDPPEEEIKTFWEENQDAYTTELGRKFSYLSLKPKQETEPETKDSDDAGDKDKDADKADEVKDEAKDEAKDEDEAKADAEAEAEKKAERELAQSVDVFLSELEDGAGADFEKLVGEYGWEIKTSEMFTRAQVPADLNLTIRGGQPGRDMGFYLFEDLSITTDPISKFTPAIPVPDGGWIIARMDEEEPVRPKTYDEARDEARADLVNQQAVEKMKKDAEDALAKLREATEGGKEFEAAAKEAGFEVATFDALGRTDRPAGLAEPNTVFDAAARVDPGSFADIVHLSDSSLVVFVAKREVVREENLRARIEAQASQETNRNRYIAFDAWLAAGRENSKMLVPKS